MSCHVESENRSGRRTVTKSVELAPRKFPRKREMRNLSTLYCANATQTSLQIRLNQQVIGSITLRRSAFRSPSRACNLQEREVDFATLVRMHNSSPQDTHAQFVPSNTHAQLVPSNTHAQSTVHIRMRMVQINTHAQFPMQIRTRNFIIGLDILDKPICDS